jgi:hypothetical protein
MTQAELMEALEPLVDASCVGDVLLALARVCNEKAEHLRTNWQDAQTARHWDAVARQIDRLAAKTDM